MTMKSRAAPLGSTAFLCTPNRYYWRFMPRNFLFSDFKTNFKHENYSSNSYYLKHIYPMKIVLKSIFIVFFYFSFLPIGHSQDMKRVRTVTDSLCSKRMNGRGYTFKGDKIAANFIKKEFETAGLSFFEQGVFQPFSLDVNVFDGDLSLKLDNKLLEAGKDFIAHAASPRAYGSGKIIFLDSATIKNPDQWLLQQKFRKAVIVYEQKNEEAVFNMPKVFVNKFMKAQCHIVVVPKMTHFISRKQQRMPKLIVAADAYDFKAKKAEFAIDAKMKYGYQTQNVIGYVEGTVKPDSFMVFTAHYDHLGGMGREAYFAGANDNASGTAMLIELAYHYAKNPPRYTVVFIAFGGEEAGLVGSRYYTALPYFPLQKIKFLSNVDLFGTGEEGTTVVNGSVLKEQFALLQKINDEKKYLKQVSKRGEAANSDHYFFYKAGVPSFFFYLRGNWTHYHDVNDNAPLPYTKFKEAFALLRDFNDALMH